MKQKDQMEEINKFNTELESIFDTLEKGKKKIATAGSGIVSEDIKNRLKSITLSLESIGKRLAKGGNCYNVNLQN